MHYFTVVEPSNWQSCGIRRNARRNARGGPTVPQNQNMFIGSLFFLELMRGCLGMFRWFLVALQIFDVGDIVAVGLFTRVNYPTEYVFECEDAGGVISIEFYDLVPAANQDFNTLDVGTFVTGGDNIPISSSIVRLIDASTPAQTANVSVLYWRAVHIDINGIDQLLVPIFAVQTINVGDLVRCDDVGLHNDPDYIEEVLYLIIAEVYCMMFRLCLFQ
jgi:hypothetical protein